jgi:hypothetical protein
MRTLLTGTVALASLFVVVAACKKQDDTQPSNVAPTATAGYPGYPPPQGTYGQYPQPAPTYGQYPQQPQPMPTAPVPAPAPAPAAAPGQMAVPGPVAFTCQNDVPCGTHHCNVQYGKCAFPCQSAADCITPNTCVMGLCVPAPPQAH